VRGDHFVDEEFAANHSADVSAGAPSLTLGASPALGDQLGHFGTWADGLDEYDLTGVQVHAIRAVQLLAALHQYVRALLGGGIGLSHDVVDFRKNRVRCSVPLHLGIVDGAIRQQDGLVGRRETYLATRRPPRKGEARHARQHNNRNQDSNGRKLHH